MGTTAVSAEHAGHRRIATAYCYWDLVPSPFRSLSVAVDGDGRLVEIRFDGRRPEGRRDAKRCKDAAAQLGEYFAGRRREFELALAPVGTDFQLRVWHALRDIPYGAVRNYGDIARAIGQPKASRAVGQANGSNPLMSEMLPKIKNNQPMIVTERGRAFISAFRLELIIHQLPLVVSFYRNLIALR